MLRQYTAAILVLVSFTVLHGQEAGFFLEEWKERTAILPEYVWKEKQGNAASILIHADMGQVLKKVPACIYGNNAVVWGGNINNHATVMADINNLNPHVLRWPGGNLSQVYFWNLTSSQTPEDIPGDLGPWYGVNDDNWQMSNDDYYDLLKNTNSTGSICVNYSYARYGTGPDPVAKAAHLAAEWVRYDKGRSRFWEIGNENFGSWEAGYKIDGSKNQDGQPEYISGQLYGQHCKVFIDSMRAAAAEIGADIKIGVVAYDAETSYDPINTSWNEGMMPEVGDLADFLIVHSYFTPYDQDSNIPAILNSHQVASHIMTDIVNDMNEAGKPMIPVAFTEWNIFAVGSMQQVSYINGMHAALVLGEFVLNDYGMATRWDLTNGWNNGDDHGMFSSGGEPGVDLYNPRPVFFYMDCFQDYFGDKMVASSVAGSDQVIAYASSFSSGEAGMVMINKGTSGEIVSVDLENHETGARYYTMTLTGGDDNGDFSRKVFLNGHGPDEEGGGPDDYKSVKAFACSARDGIQVDLPPLSVVYLMVEAKGPLSYVSSKIETDPQVIQVELSEDVMPVDDPAGFEVLVNGVSSVGITGIERVPERHYLLNMSLDRRLHKEDVLTLSYSGGAVVTSDGIALPSFNNEMVTNQLPGDPCSVSLMVKIVGTDTPVADCQVSFNGVTAFTNDTGKVVFAEPEGSYLLSAYKKHLVPFEEQWFTMNSDTLLTLELDSASYQVQFQLTDNQTGRPLSQAEVSSGSSVDLTSLEGLALLSLHAGTHQFLFNAHNYTESRTIISIDSDSAFLVSLVQSHARVKFKLNDGQTPVNNALVVVGSDSLYTGQLGICTYESIPLETTVNYQVKRENFNSMAGTLAVMSDTTLALQMEKSVANVTFEVISESGPATDARVILGRDTGVVNSSGICKFYQVSKDQDYTFQVFGDAFRTYTGILNVVHDTTLYVALALTGFHSLEVEAGLRIWPNPASERVFIESFGSEIAEVELMDLRGACLILNSVETPQRSCELTLDIPAGIYIIKIRTGQKVHSKRIQVY